MESTEIQFYRCPLHHSPLTMEGGESGAEAIESGELVCGEGRRYRIERGVPNLIYPDELCEIEAQTKESYDKVAEKIYDAAVDWQFAAIKEDEDAVRELMVDMLEMEPGFRVLEIGCGTGRDSFRLARRLEKNGALFMQDLSPNMVYNCQDKMAQYDEKMNFSCARHYFISNASYLPFEDGFFDAVFHFGGFNEFGEKERAANEFTRVTKTGGRILYGDESVAPWLRGTEFEGIVTTNNPLFSHELPLATVPECARDVQVRWVMGNCFYVIAFTKGDGPPALELDLPHAGSRGGTMRTRYFGNLEGVTLETKELARAAAAKSGLGMHQWLDQLVRGEAEKALEGGAKTGAKNDE